MAYRFLNARTDPPFSGTLGTRIPVLLRHGLIKQSTRLECESREAAYVGGLELTVLPQQTRVHPWPIPPLLPRWLRSILVQRVRYTHWKPPT